MEFNQFIEKAWGDHAADAKSVFDRLNEAEKWIISNENIPVLTRLIVHICGDHLGLWKEGIEKLESLKLNPHYLKNSESEFAIDRSIAILKLGSGDFKELAVFSDSDQIRILAQTAGMISERGDLNRAKEYFNSSLAKAKNGLAQRDPAYRALAVTGNNLACFLEEKVDRSEHETEFMILAAQTARKYWEMAGGPSEVAAAEYRLVQSYLQASQIEKSFEHAKLCIAYCEEHKCSALDHFFAYEALALVEKYRKNDIGYSKAIEKIKYYFDLLSEEDQKWCQKTLERFS